MGAAMPSISVIIITHNEAHTLPACIRSVESWVDEIVVVDSGSTDGTADVCRAHPKIAFHEQAWLGFGPQKNAALDRAQGEWVLSLDADERVTPQLAVAIQGALAAKDCREVGFALDRQMVFMGKRLRFGGCRHDWVLRLFRRAAGRFEDMALHERVVVQGPTARLAGGRLLHEPYRSIDGYFRKFSRYTALAAEQRWEAGVRPLSTPRMALRLWGEFMKRYILFGGVADGLPGLVYCSLSAMHHFVKFAKLAELYDARGASVPARDGRDGEYALRNGYAGGTVRSSMKSMKG